MTRIKKISTFTMILLIMVFMISGCGDAQSDLKSNRSSSSDNQNITSTKNSHIQNVYMVIEPYAKLGSDGKYHDAYINGNIKITKGQKITLNIYNYDDTKHNYTAPDLNLNIQAKASSKKGKPGVTKYTFTPKKEGKFNWSCVDTYDQENNSWAIAHNGFMKGTITVLPSTNKTHYVSLVVMPSGKLGSDGKLHDAYTPGDFTINSGQPVHLTVYNLDTGRHSFTSNPLKVNLSVKGASKKGQPSVQTVTFIPKKAGEFQWHCTVPCDNANGDWAMFHDNFMRGTITVN